MRKSLLVAGAAMLVLGASMTSFAAKGWTEEGGAWYYYNNSGDKVIDDWKKSGADWYWLGDDGAMVTDQLVNDGDNTYYVNANGAMVKDAWIPIAADDTDTDLDVEYRWYYFKTNGKAQKDSTAPVSIHGKKYWFDQDGKMLFGFVDANANMLYGTDDAILKCDRYFGTNDDGSMHVDWLQYTDGVDNNTLYEDKTELWVYFNTTNGKKYANANQEKKIRGKWYYFDDNGIMTSDWTIESGKTTAQSKYFNAETDGHLQKKSWVYVVPSKDLNSNDYEADQKRWFYVDSTGSLTVDTVKKIGGKWYAFNNVGIMKKGLIALQGKTVADDPTTINPELKIETTISGDDYTKRTYLAAFANKNVYFFSNDEANDGAMKTGTYKIELLDGEYNFTFAKGGKALNEIKNHKIYEAGILATAGDDRYKDYTTSVAGATETYIIGASGTILKKGQYGKNADDYYYAINQNGNMIKIYGDKAAKKASEYAKGSVNAFTDSADAKLVEDLGAMGANSGY